jgi:hypothetical protein
MLRVTLLNQLQLGVSTSASTASVSSVAAEQIPCAPENCTDLLGSRFKLPNTTNLHTHGLHVSPALGSDDVMDVRIAPGESFSYTYRIPDDHAAGTFWYHPHFEGSTALQVAGGAAGALIVRDPPGRGLPEWLVSMPTQLLVIQELAFAQLSGVSGYSNDSVFRIDSSGRILPVGWEEETKENNQHGEDPSTRFNASLIDNVAVVNGAYQPVLNLTSTAGRWHVGASSTLAASSSWI